MVLQSRSRISAKHSYAVLIPLNPGSSPTPRYVNESQHTNYRILYDMRFTTGTILAFAASTLALVPCGDKKKSPLCKAFVKPKFDAYSYECCRNLNANHDGVDCEYGKSFL